MLPEKVIELLKSREFLDQGAEEQVSQIMDTILTIFEYSLESTVEEKGDFVVFSTIIAGLSHHFLKRD